MTSRESITKTRTLIDKNMISNKQPTIELDEDGKFMTIDGVLQSVIHHHSFDDFGATIDTFRVMNYASDVIEIYSVDECETFSFEAGDH